MDSRCAQDTFWSDWKAADWRQAGLRALHRSGCALRFRWLCEAVEAGDAAGNGQALLFEAREKCSRLLAAADATSDASAEHADASPAAQLLLVQRALLAADRWFVDAPMPVGKAWLSTCWPVSQVGCRSRPDST